MYVGIFYFSKSIFHYNLCFKVIRTSGLLPLSNPLFYRWYHFPTELIITVDYDGVRLSYDKMSLLLSNVERERIVRRQIQRFEFRFTQRHPSQHVGFNRRSFGPMPTPDHQEIISTSSKFNENESWRLFYCVG
jgi:hypothetical protein